MLSWKNDHYFARRKAGFVCILVNAHSPHNKATAIVGGALYFWFVTIKSGAKPVCIGKQL